MAVKDSNDMISAMCCTKLASLAQAGFT